MMFKVGDRVRDLESADESRGVVKDVREGQIRVHWDGHRWFGDFAQWWPVEDFELVHEPKFSLGDSVRKIKGSSWSGKVVGTYSTSLTPEGYAVESSTETGSVQIYPAAALEAM